MPEDDDEVMKWKEEYGVKGPERKMYPSFEHWAESRRRWCRFKSRYEKIYPFHPDKNHIYHQSMDSILQPDRVRSEDLMERPKKKRKRK